MVRRYDEIKRGRGPKPRSLDLDGVGGFHVTLNRWVIVEFLDEGIVLGLDKERAFERLGHAAHDVCDFVVLEYFHRGSPVVKRGRGPKPPIPEF